MTNSISLKQLKKLAKARGDVAAHRLGRMIEQRAAAQSQLQALIDYRSDYQARLEAAARAGIHGEGLRNYRVFLANLERAIEQQTEVTHQMERRFRDLHAEWTHARRKVESFRVLGEREARTVAGKEHRRQQTLQDEIATHTFLKDDPADLPTTENAMPIALNPSVPPTPNLARSGDIEDSPDVASPSGSFADALSTASNAQPKGAATAPTEGRGADAASDGETSGDAVTVPEMAAAWAPMGIPILAAIAATADTAGAADAVRGDAAGSGARFDIAAPSRPISTTGVRATARPARAMASGDDSTVLAGSATRTRTPLPADIDGSSEVRKTDAEALAAGLADRMRAGARAGAQAAPALATVAAPALDSAAPPAVISAAPPAVISAAPPAVISAVRSAAPAGGSAAIPAAAAGGSEPAEVDFVPPTVPPRSGTSNPYADAAPFSAAAATTQAPAGMARNAVEPAGRPQIDAVPGSLQPPTQSGGATTPAVVTIAAPVHSAGWPLEVAQQVAQVIVLRNETAEIRLNPPQLGPVDVRISFAADQPTLLITAPDPATRGALEQALPHLRDLLAEQGITLGQATVQGDRQPPQAFAQQGPDRAGVGVANAGAAVDAPPRATRTDWLVDLYA